MEIKTVGDLKKMILEYRGKIDIGPLAIEYSESRDIDVKLHGSVVMWISRTVEDETLLSDGINLMDIFREKNPLAEEETLESVKEQKSILERNLEKAQTEIADLKTINSDSAGLRSKVEVYDALFASNTIHIIK